MSIKERLTQLIDYLIEIELISSVKEFAEIIGENSNGISDLKAGRKKFTIEHLINVKNKFPNVNINWLMEGRGDMTIDFASFEQERANFREKIEAQQKEIAGLKKENSELQVMLSAVAEQLVKYRKEDGLLPS